MDPKVIDGKKLAAEHEDVLRERVAGLSRIPHIMSILVGDNPPSLIYSNLKKKKAEELGISFELVQFPSSTGFGFVVDKIIELNQNSLVDGIMIQLPLPEEFLGNHTTEELINKIDPKKDVDGLTGKGPVFQAAVRGILSMLKSENIDLKISKVALVGAKGMVGSELVNRLKELGANIEEVDKETKNPGEIERQADVLISAVGKKNLITADCVKSGATVIDVGGDVDFENVKEVAGRITPPRGGVGPMTVVSLMENAVELVHGVNG